MAFFHLLVFPRCNQPSSLFRLSFSIHRKALHFTIRPQLGVKTDVLATNKIVKWSRPHYDSRVWCHRGILITNVLATSGIVKWNRAQLVRRADLQWVWSGLVWSGSWAWPWPGLWFRSWPWLLLDLASFLGGSLFAGPGLCPGIGHCGPGPGLSVPLPVCTPARPKGYRKIRRAKACDSCARRRAPRGGWKSPAPAPQGSCLIKASRRAVRRRTVRRLPDTAFGPSQPRNVPRRRAAHQVCRGPRSPQASAVELSDCPVRR